MASKHWQGSRREKTLAEIAGKRIRAAYIGWPGNRNSGGGPPQVAISVLFAHTRRRYVRYMRYVHYVRYGRYLCYVRYVRCVRCVRYVR